MATISKEEVISLLRACLISSKGGVSINSLNRDFQNLEGYFIPYKQFGCPTLETFLQNIPDFQISRNKSGDFMVQAKPNPNSEHIQKLVELQKSSHKVNKSRQRQYYNNYCSPKLRRPYGPQAKINRHDQPERLSVPKHNVSKLNTNNSSIKEKTATKFNCSSSFSQDQQFDQQQSSTQNPYSYRKSECYPKLTINLQRSNSNYEDWSRRVNSTLSHNGTKSPLPPSPPLSPMPIQGVSEIEKAVYPPASAKKDFTRNQSVSKNRHNMQPMSGCHKTQSCVQTLALFAKENGLNFPQFKTSSMYQDKKVVFISRVQVGQYSAFDPTIRKGSKKEAEEVAAKLMLLKIPDLLKAEHALMPTTKDVQLMAARIRELIEKYPNGTWASEIPGVYSKHYSECLCENWLTLIEDNDMYELKKWDNTKILVQLTTDVKVTPLVPPSKMFWEVHVTNVVSSEEVWLRILGDGYSDKLHQLTEEMTTAKNTLKFGLKQVHIGKYVLAQLWDTDINELTIHRAQVLYWEEGSDSALCLLPDLGLQETISLADMACLPVKFIALPFQAMKCSLKNLSVFREHVDVNKFLEDALKDKVLIASCPNSTENKRAVELFDTSTLEDINLNNKFCEIIATQLLITSLPQGMNVIEVSVPCVLPTCEVFIQPQPCLVQYIENYLQMFMTEILEQQPLHFFDTSEMYVTYCPDIHHMAQGDTAGSTQQREVLARVVIKKDLKFLPSQQDTEVFFVDYGWSRVINSAMLKKLKAPLSNILKIPHQAIFCKLRGVPPQPNLLVKASAMDRLKKLAPPGKLVAMRISTTSRSNNVPVIELFSRTQPENLVCSINDTIAMDMTLFEDK